MSKKDQPTPSVIVGRGSTQWTGWDPRAPVRVLHQGGDKVTDMDLAWVYLRGMLACLHDQAEVERQVEAAPALAVLLSYRHAAHRARALGEQ